MNLPNTNIFLNVSKRFNCVILRRFKHKDSHWSVVRKKKSHSERALDHFNEFYSTIFKKDWTSIRQGLLARQKYVAVVNNFSDSERVRDELERSGALNLRTLLNLEKEYLSENKKMFNKKAKEVFNKIGDKKIDKDNVETERSFDVNSNRVISGNDLILTEFVPTTKIKGMEDFITESEHYSYYDKTELSLVNIEKQHDFHFSKNLNVYLYDTMDNETFKPPRKGSTDVYDYYLLDGGSILSVLALDIQPNDKILDMCSAPGGKSLLALQTLYPGTVVCNDVSKSRVDRIRSVMRQYLYDFEEKWIGTGKLRIMHSDGREIVDEEFDRVLVDVPCTTDRHSVNHEDNNIFKPDRVKERLKLPELQCDLLVQALKLVRDGGVVVYSTCTLSPIQNDGVVHMALKRIAEETKLAFKVIDLSAALLQVLTTYKMAAPNLMKYGHLVLPNLSRNFGPSYFCKLQRTG